MGDHVGILAAVCFAFAPEASSNRPRCRQRAKEVVFLPILLVTTSVLVAEEPEPGGGGDGGGDELVVASSSSVASLPRQGARRESSAFGLRDSGGHGGAKRLFHADDEGIW